MTPHSTLITRNSRLTTHHWWRTLAILLACAIGLFALPAPHANAQREGAAQNQREGERDQGPFGALRWRNVGPNRGGRSIAVAGSDARPLEYYFGATGGGLWKTTDGGTTWRPVTDGLIHSSSVGAVAIAPSNPDIVYIGTGEADIRGNIIQGDGVYRSTDAGKTWTNAGLAETQVIAKIRVHPANPDVVYAAAFGHPAGPNEERGVYRSKDGGRTWQRMLFRDAKSGAIELVLDPHDPQVLYAALWEALRVSHMMSSGGPGSGLFTSTDGGDHWTELTRNPGLPRGTIGKIGLSVSGADSARVYAQVEAEDGGLFVSDDRGASWKKINENRNLRQRAFYYSRVYADPKDKDTVYALNVGMHKSTDGGKTFKAIRPPHGDNHDLWISAADPKRMIEGNDGGANVSVNGGETWTPQTFPTAQFYHVATTTDVPYHICGAQQDNSTACVSSRAGGRGPGGSGPGPMFYAVGGGESGYVASDPRHPDVFFAGSYGGLMTRYNRKTGQTRAVNAYPDNPMGYASEDIAERFQWTFPIVFSPVDPTILYIGSQHVWKSTDEGQSWTKISPDLTRHDPATLGPSGGPITKDQTGVETYATVFTIAPSPKDASLIWTGSDDGDVCVTRDGGKNWKHATPKGMPDFARISVIEASPFRPGTAYVAANHYQHDDFAPYVFRTDDYGETWTEIVKGIRPRDFARAIREDPQRARLLYLGTEHGIYVSFDDGVVWQSLQQNLPDTPVHDIKVEARDLVIATHGRSFYVMDNIAALRQMTVETSSAALHVYRPHDVLRGVERSAAVDFSLKKDAKQVAVEILDGSGKPIRTFKNGGDEPARKEEGERKKEEGSREENDEEAPFRRPPEPKLSTKAGLHRLTWDLRYPGPVDFPGLIMWAAGTQGPIAPPGQYQVRVTADAATMTQPFEIRREPHILADVTDADLTDQFALAMKIRDKTSQANEAVLLVRGITPQIQDRLGRLDSKTGPTARALYELEHALRAIESEIYQVKNQSSQDPLNYPIKLNNRIAALLGVVESADTRPTAQSHDVFRVLSGQLDTELSKLDAAVKTSLPHVNRMLQRQRMAPIKAEPLKAGGSDRHF